jgi:hypothetical protein
LLWWLLCWRHRPRHWRRWRLLLSPLLSILLWQCRRLLLSPLLPILLVLVLLMLLRLWTWWR